MKLQNKKTNIFLGSDAETEASYADLILWCIQSPSVGIPSNSMELIGKVIGKLETTTGKKAITFSKEEYMAIYPLIDNHMWQAYHEDLENFIKDFKEVN